MKRDHMFVQMFQWLLNHKRYNIEQLRLNQLPVLLDDRSDLWTHWDDQRELHEMYLFHLVQDEILIFVSIHGHEQKLHQEILDIVLWQQRDRQEIKYSLQTIHRMETGNFVCVHQQMYEIWVSIYCVSHVAELLSSQNDETIMDGLL